MSAPPGGQPPEQPRAAGPVGAFRDHLRNPFHRNAYLLMANQVASAALGVGYWVLVARLYDAETVGRNAALIATLMFLAMVAQFGMKDATTRFVGRAGERARALVVRAYVVVVACSVVAGAAWVAIASATGSRGSIEKPALAVWLVISVASTALFYVQDGVLSGARRTGLVLAENGAYNVAKIVLLVILANAAPSYGILLSWTLPMPIFIAWISWVIFRRVLPQHDASAEDELPSTGMLARWVVGDHVGALFTEAAARLLPLIVVHQLGDTQNAYFYQAWVIASTLPLLAGSGTTAFIVEATQHPEELRPLARRTLYHLARLLLPVAAVGLVAAPWVLRVFGADYADNGTATLRWLLLGILPGLLVIWFLGYARVTNHINRIVAMQAIASLATLALALALVPEHGIEGAGIAWLAGQACGAVAALLWGRPVLFGGGHGPSAVAAGVGTHDRVREDGHHDR